MSASVGFGAGFNNGGDTPIGKASGKNVRTASGENIRDTIERLQNEREKFENEKKSTGGKELDRKIGDLEKRINNLQKRLDKIESEDGECQTCKNRRYQDDSDDPGVSFKSATKVSPGAAGAAVRGHEMEHVSRNQAKADREGREVVYQSVTIKHAICPECGRTYVSGGETTTVTRSKPEDERFEVGMRDEEAEKGNFLDVTV